MARTIVIFGVLLFVASSQSAYYLKRYKDLPPKLIFPSGKIVGGEDIDITKVPHQIQLEDSGYQICGGSILSSRYALTAAHCTADTFVELLKIRYGTSFHVSGGTHIQVASFAQHPLFDDERIDFDVSVLYLEEDIIFSESAQPVALINAEPNAGEIALVSGWGNLESGGCQPEQLQSVTLPIVDRTVCTDVYANIPNSGGWVITKNMICAGGLGQDSCQGDSGGAMVIEGVQVGVVSWGYGCAVVGYPGVYSNVAVLRDFIDENSSNTTIWV